MSRTAATIAAATAPPDPSTETTANCAEPANVVSDITIGAATPMPASRARTPNDAPKATTAIARGAAARAPAAKELGAPTVIERRRSDMMVPASTMME